MNFLEKINKIYPHIETLLSAVELLDADKTAQLEALTGLSVDEIVADLKKSHYLGRRKTEIALSLNNESEDTNVIYDRATISLDDGTSVVIDFLTDQGATYELSSHYDIKDYITSHADYLANVINTEVTYQEATADKPAHILIVDTDGKYSNISSISLRALSGQYTNANPTYVWADYTSSLEVIGNSITPLTLLGDNINAILTLAQNGDKYTALADNETQYLALYDIRTAIASLHTNMTAILNAETHAETASQKATEATNARDQIVALSGNQVVNTLTAGGSASANYSSETGKFTFNIPEGEKGERGDSFTPDKQGSLANKTDFDDMIPPFSYLAIDDTDDAGNIVPKIYFKQSATSGDWSAGAPFGQGVGIDNHSFTSTTAVNGLPNQAGETDTYTWTLTNGQNYTYTISHGADAVDNTNIKHKNPTTMGIVEVADNTNMLLLNPVTYDELVWGDNATITFI